MQEALSGIIGAYERDFAKHPNLSEFPKISMIWKSVPSQLARENKKFIYKVVKEGARAREYEDALQWLVDVGLLPEKVKLRIRFSLDNLKLDDDVLNIPLFMADQAERLIGLALEQRCNFLYATVPAGTGLESFPLLS